MQKKNGVKQNMTTFILVVFLALFICTYIILQSSWAFFRESESVFGNIEFGKIDVEWIGKQGDTTENLTILNFQAGHYMVGTDIPFSKNIHILNNGNNDMFVRVLVSVIYNAQNYTDYFNFAGITLSTTDPDAWTYDSENKVYYYNKALLPTGDIGFFTHFVANASGDYIFPDELFNKDLHITFTAEAIQTSLEAYKTWLPAPPLSWENLIS